MPFKVTFLEGNKPLTKFISPEKTTNYPHTKIFTSHSFLIKNITQFFDKISAHAKKGHCLLKGPIAEDIIKESRAGMVPNTTLTSWLVLDIDSAEFKIPKAPLSKAKLEQLTEKIIKTLPKYFRNVSYIAQASASLGFIQNKASLHLFFLLDTEVQPATLKQSLTNMNFELDYYRENLGLTKTGWDVKYTLDRCVADNTRIIYIAPPEIKDKPDPFKLSTDRIILTKKKNEYLPTAPLLELAGANYGLEKNQIINKLRKEQGLNNKYKARYENLLIDGKPAHILRNPTPGSLSYAYTARGYVYYNLNGGNSNGYYHPIGKPDFIYNFKSEPIFRWIDVDEAGYDAYVAANTVEIQKANPINNFCIISKQDDLVYKVGHNTELDTLRLSASDLTKAKHFYKEHGMIMPETLLEWDIAFDPKSLTKVNYEQKVINTYDTSEYIKEAKQLTTTPEITDLEKLCPTIHKLLFHVLGEGTTEYIHFLNWLAFVLQVKEKTNTCWFMWGTQGTGKGLLYNYVLKPLFGEQNLGMHLGSAIEDKFDAWRINKQLIVIDEFELPKGKTGDRIMEKIKNWVAETDNSVRAMQKVSENIKGIEAFIFFSNKHDMIQVEDRERRFNIAPRQEKKIDAKPWFDSKQIVDQLNDELQIFTNFILSVQVDLFNARQALNNEAKKMAANASRTQAENFCNAILNHNLDYFLDLLYLTPDDVPPEDMNAQIVLKTAQLEVRRWLADQAIGTKIGITSSQLATVYRAITFTDLSAPAVSKMLARRGISNKPSSYNGKKGRFYFVEFNDPELTNQEKQVLIKAAPGTHVADILGKTA